MSYRGWSPYKADLTRARAAVRHWYELQAERKAAGSDLTPRENEELLKAIEAVDDAEMALDDAMDKL